MASKKSTAAPSAAAPPATAPTKDKAENFRRLATARVNRCAHQIKLIANLANRSSYEYTVDQAALVLATLDEALKHVERAFTTQVAKSKDLVQF